MVRLCCPVFGQGRIDNDTASNKRRRHTPDQIVRKLAEGNVASLACPVRRHEGQRGQRLKELKAENAQLTEGGAVPRSPGSAETMVSFPRVRRAMSAAKALELANCFSDLADVKLPPLN